MQCKNRTFTDSYTFYYICKLFFINIPSILRNYIVFLCTCQGIYIYYILSPKLIFNIKLKNNK